MNNFTFGNHLRVSLGVQLTKDDGSLRASLHVTFTNTGNQDFAIEFGQNLGYYNRCGPALVSGPFLSGVDCGYCPSYEGYPLPFGQGFRWPILKVKAGTSVEWSHLNVGGCYFNSARAGLYSTDYEISFFRHNATICEMREKDICFINKSTAAEEAYVVPVKIDFEIPEELSGHRWYTNIESVLMLLYTDTYSVLLYGLSGAVLAGMAHKMCHRNSHIDHDLHDL